MSNLESFEPITINRMFTLKSSYVYFEIKEIVKFPFFGLKIMYQQYINIHFLKLHTRSPLTNKGLKMVFK